MLLPAEQRQQNAACLQPSQTMVSITRCHIRLKGHPKTGQRRSPQNRPMKAARDQVVLPQLAVVEQACFSTPTPWATLENVTMMEEALEYGGHGRTIP